MAQKVQTPLVDDLDGSQAEGTVRLGLDSTEHEIDLNAKHARELRNAWPAMQPLAAGPAPVPGGQPAAGVKRSRTP